MNDQKERPLRLLMVEDRPEDAELMVRELRRAGFDPDWERVDTEAGYAAGLRPELDIVLSDFSMPEFSGLRALEVLRERGLDIPFILVSGTIGEDIAVAAMRQGASDYLLKDRLTRLGPAVEHAIGQRRLRKESAHAEKAMRESEHKYRHLFESLSEPAFLIECASRRILDVNICAQNLLGLTRTQILGKDAWTLLPAAAAPETVCPATAMSECKGGLVEAEVRTVDGKLVPVLISVAPVDLYGRNLVLTLMTDITARKQAEDVLREQASMLDQAHEAIIDFDIHTLRVTYWNHGAERLYGRTSADAKGREIGPLIFADPAVADTITEHLLATGEWRGECRQLTESGRELIANAHATLVRDAAGMPKSALVINIDITAQKQLEEQLLRSQRMEGIGTLACGIANDFNNVLAPIMMAVGVLKTRLPDPASQELLAILTASARHGADMVRQILFVGAGVGGPRQIDVNLKRLLLEIEKIANDTFLKQVQVRVNIPDDLWTVTGDPTPLHQVLLNLCVNARESMPEGGTLTLTAENISLDAQYAGMHRDARVGPYVLIQVADSGIGMAPEILGKIFDPFFSSKATGRGTGLGLSTSLSIVRNHGGFIRVESEPGAGSRFMIYLPARAGTSDPAAAEMEGELAHGNGELILVVDDEASVSEINQQTLEAFGYRVILAADGVEAVAAYASHHDEISVVIMDMVMPVMDGPSAIKILKSIHPDARIIAASGLAANEHAAAAAEAGVKHFLAKPYTAETLLTMIRDILQEP